MFESINVEIWKYMFKLINVYTNMEICIMLGRKKTEDINYIL